MRNERSMLTSAANVGLDLARSLDAIKFEGMKRKVKKGKFIWESQDGPCRLVCFNLQFPDMVLCAIACPPELARRIKIYFDEEDHLRVSSHQLEVDLDFGVPGRGGTSEYDGIVGLSGKEVGAKARKRLGGRGLLADSFREEEMIHAIAAKLGISSDWGKCSIVLVGLQEGTGGDITVFKIVDIGEEGLKAEGDQLVELILTSLAADGAI